MSQEESVIIVAGGSGIRMGSDIPKQFIEIGGKPILMRTMEAFFNYNSDIEIILVLPESHVNYWEKLCDTKNFNLNHKVSYGGLSRGESVQNGLNAVEKKGLVAIHDGVRPFVPIDVVREAFSVAQVKGNAVVAIDLKDTLRWCDKHGNSKVVKREEYKIIQTPQIFQYDIIVDAYKALSVDENLSDDSGVVERQGIKINLTKGSYSNIKITTRDDLAIAEGLL